MPTILLDDLLTLVETNSFDNRHTLTVTFLGSVTQAVDNPFKMYSIATLFLNQNVVY